VPINQSAYQSKRLSIKASQSNAVVNQYSPASSR